MKVRVLTVRWGGDLQAFAPRIPARQLDTTWSDWILGRTRGAASIVPEQAMVIRFRITPRVPPGIERYGASGG